MTSTAAIIQARTGSTRLPRKVLKDIAGRPMLWHVVERIKRCRTINTIVVATTELEEDRVILDLARSLGVESFAGATDDVLDRYYQAAKAFDADPVVRITADCPVIDPEIVDEVVEFYLSGDYDACSLEGGFPDGLDVAVFSFSALSTAWRKATLPSEREHVGPYIENHPERFHRGSYEKFGNLGHLRWTVDEERDLRFIRAIYERLYREGEIFLTGDILDLLQREPDLLEINAGIIRNEGYLKSLKRDSEVQEARKL